MAIENGKPSDALDIHTIEEGRDLIARQQRWLMGTVRRMKWVVSQKKQLEKDLKSRSLYVGKLETKLLKKSKVQGE